MEDETTRAEFTRFVLITGARLHRSALMLVGDPHLAEDLLQTTYAQLFASWPRVRRAGNPVGYIHTTLTSAFLSHRRVRRSFQLPTGALADRPDRGLHTSVTDARFDLVSALALLPPVDRAVVVLRYWEDLTVADTAAALGLTEQAVRNRASRSLARIRHHVTPVTEELS